jgi:hypothetical protein
VGVPALIGVDLNNPGEQFFLKRMPDPAEFLSADLNIKFRRNGGGTGTIPFYRPCASSDNDLSGIIDPGGWCALDEIYGRFCFSKDSHGSIRTR